MGEAFHCGGRPFSKYSAVPPRSRLADFLRYLHLDYDWDAQKAHAGWRERILREARSPEFEEGLLELLRATGLPLDLDNLIHVHVFNLVAADARSVWVDRWASQPSRRRGNPGLDDTLSMIAFHAVNYRQQEGRDRSACWTIAARDLGPGIRSDHVRRAERHARQMLTRALKKRETVPPQVGELLTKAILSYYRMRLDWAAFMVERDAKQTKILPFKRQSLRGSMTHARTTKGGAHDTSEAP